MGRLSKIFRKIRKQPGADPGPHHLLKESKWVSKKFLIQAVDDEMSDVMAEFPDREECAPRPSFTHIINLFPAPSEDSTQENTITSMSRAATGYDGDVRLINVQSKDDEDQTPAGFERAPDIMSTISDLKSFSPIRPLPFVFDIIENGVTVANDGDFVVFTNADICLQPHFYSAVAELLAFGFDALVINRRTVGAEFERYFDSPLLAAETGKTHPGFDCFVFQKCLFNDFVRNNSCVGIAGVGQGLLYNLIGVSKKMLLLANATLTYHLGNDRDWLDETLREYTEHNQQEYLGTVRTLLTTVENPESLIGYFRNCANPKEARSLFREFFPGTPEA